MVSRLMWLLMAAALFTGCSGANSPDADLALPRAAAATPTPLVRAPTTPPRPNPPATPTTMPPTPAEPVEPVEAAADDPKADTVGSVPPVEADSGEVSSDIESDPTTAWISRRFMSASGIEVVWSEIEGAVEYQVHRLQRSTDDEPDESEMNDANLVHSGSEKGVFLDAGVTPGTRYWHGVRGLDADGVVLAVGWHRTVAITDEQPPDSVQLSLERQIGSVLLTWSAPAENYQLHSYRILRAVDGGPAETVAQTWNLDQISFLDTDPPQAVVTYSVVAFDFHWNGSEPTELTLDLS